MGVATVVSAFGSASVVGAFSTTEETTGVSTDSSLVTTGSLFCGALVFTGVSVSTFTGDASKTTTAAGSSLLTTAEIALVSADSSESSLIVLRGVLAAARFSGASEGVC